MDYRLAHTLDSFSARHDGFEDLMRGYVSASELLFVAAIVALLLVPGARRQMVRRAGAAAAASVGIALLVAHFLAAAIDRPRPFVTHAATIHPFLVHAADPSFPSEHATAAFAIATAVALRLRLPGAILLALAGLLAVGRVFLGLHYPSDVLAGAALGAGIAALGWLPPIRNRLHAVADAAGRRADSALRRQPSWLRGSTGGGD
jgi:undecaprenyl-diphosphatase